ncbi:ChbG/HpnK family deacetylase [Paraconexibacter algicola]|uniref:ChbG/HpnK family deacetylase n=1 Tax=Paraconexibacter algicola TaxID=2133960 RepID=A0A2T4UGW9_9ACTN|nr:ChbG/HpnK family deacetylase [Paraconexibacter algicola]PTL58467.1 hypothetical protein C7Y72_01760 [Paraconexibacter algicola]
MGDELLIVNADDWGASVAVTDAIARAHAAGAITSTTGMVFMADSVRAAALARERGLPTGLHLNLTEALDGPGVGAEHAARHARLRAHFADLPRRRWRYTRAVRRDVAAEIAVQLAEHRRLYGAPPGHVDSHHHVHVCPDVLLSPALPRGTRVRQTRSAPPGAGAPRTPQALASTAKATLMRRRFTTTSRFWAIADVHPALEGAGLDAALAAARGRTVEVMVHPGFPDELPLLLADDWRAFVAAARAGDYGALRPSSRRRASAMRLPG